MGNIDEEVDSSLVSDYANNHYENNSNMSSFECGTFNDLDCQPTARVLQENLSTLRDTISLISRLIIGRLSVPAWTLARVLFDKWFASHQGVIQGPWLRPAPFKDSCKSLCESLHLQTQDEPVRHSLQVPDHKTLQDQLLQLFQMAEDAKQRCNEAYEDLNRITAMTQYQIPDFGLDYIRFSPVSEYQPYHDGFVTGLGDLVTVGKFISDAILDEDQALGVTTTYANISSEILQKRNLETSLRFCTHGIGLQRMYWDPDLHNAQLQIEKLGTEIKVLESEEVKLLRKHVAKNSDRSFQIMDELFHILKA